ncbi:MAG: hypothetical protein WC561_06100, partial [Candidatus Omnitrophota bacterium]
NSLYNPTVALDVNGDIKTNAGITLGGVRRTTWPTLSCRTVHTMSSDASIYCNADEYMTGGGCFWEEVEDAGNDYLHGHPTNTSGSTLGQGYRCSNDAGERTETYAVCCK